MITSHSTTKLDNVSSQAVHQSLPQRSHPRWRRVLAIHPMAWICLALACLGASWFAYQSVLVPQPEHFSPEWASARWIQTAGGTAPIAYFRYTMNLNDSPDSAFVTIAANQVFKLYVDGAYIGSNYTDFVQGSFPRAYIYDITSPLQVGANVVAVRVANVDEQAPSVKVNIGIVRGNSIYNLGSGSNWSAAFRSTDVYPRYATQVTNWTSATFDASSWPPAQGMAIEPVSPMLNVNPPLYERRIAARWVSAGLGHDAYFVTQFSVPFGITGAWLRLAASGIAHIYINGHLFIIWNGQADVRDQNLADYLGNNVTTVEYRAGLMLGMYDIGSYLQPGMNTIAIHVLSPGVSADQVGLGSLTSAMSTDVLISDFMGHSSWLTTESGWHASGKPVSGWEDGNSLALNWASPFQVGRPGAVRTLYLPENVTPRDQEPIPLLLSLQVIFVSIVCVIGSWLVMSLFVMRRYYHTRVATLETMSMAYVPAVTLECLLIALSREPQMPQPFPYTMFWAMLLVAVIGFGYLVLWLHARKAQKQQGLNGPIRTTAFTFPENATPLRDGLPRLYRRSSQEAMPAFDGHLSLRLRLWAWLRIHWMLIFLMFLAIPMVGYQLNYEPYWQDELSSYNAALGILAHGLPLFPSGFLYTKAELYSYLLALWIHLFGDQQGVLRFLSAIEYLLSLPLLYKAGRYFFDRRVALLATAMLAFSPFSLIWGRQVRMYEQAQLLTLLTVFLFYKALEERQKVYLVYLAAACLAVDYLSHEEIFIILPALLLCILLASRDDQHRLPSVLYQKHWWIAAMLCATVIGLQLLAAKFTPPPVLGTDSSQRPFVQFTTDNIPYYIDLLFFPQVFGHGTYPFITINSILAAAGCICARRATDKRIRYCALFLVVSLLTLIFAFTMQADRYVYPLLPFFYLMGAYMLGLMFRGLRSFARSRIVRREQDGATRPAFGGYLLASTTTATSATSATNQSRPIGIITSCTVGLVVASVLVTPILPLSNYNLFVSRVVGFSYHRHYPDYDAVGQYMRQHMRQGDIVISVSPAISVRYYTGHVDYFFSIDRALYLQERDGHIIEKASSAQALLNQDDFQAVLSKYSRVWIISDNGLYQAAVIQRFSFPPDFHIVFEGYGSAVYFRGS